MGFFFLAFLEEIRKLWKGWTVYSEVLQNWFFQTPLCSKLAPLSQGGHRKSISLNVRNFWPALYHWMLAESTNEWQHFQHLILWSADYIFGRVYLYYRSQWPKTTLKHIYIEHNLNEVYLAGFLQELSISRCKDKQLIKLSRGYAAQQVVSTSWACTCRERHKQIS